MKNFNENAVPEELKTLVFAYFHQDWNLTHKEWQDVVKEFSCNEGPQVVSNLRMHIYDLYLDRGNLQSPLSQTVEDWLNRELGGTDFLRYVNSLSFKDWLCEIAEVLRKEGCT